MLLLLLLLLLFKMRIAYEKERGKKEERVCVVYYNNLKGKNLHEQIYMCMI